MDSYLKVKKDTWRGSSVGCQVKRSVYLLDEKQTTIARHKQTLLSKVPPPFFFISCSRGTQKISRRKAGIHISLAWSWTRITGLQRKGKRTGQGIRTGRRRKRRKANAIKTARVKAIERGAREVNLEQISIVTEREGCMFLSANKRGFTQQVWS